METDFIWLAGFVFISYTTLAITGFGSIIIAITLGAHLYPIEILLPILVPLTLFINLYLIIRYHKTIDTNVLFKNIIPFMGVGLVIGILLFTFIQGILLKRLFGILVILLSSKELVRIFKNEVTPPKKAAVSSSIYILSAGIIHGIYASGGPLLVYAINKLGLTKSSFRSTLSSLWMTLNTVLTLFYIGSGKITMDTVKTTGMLLPIILVGLIIGEIVHRYINERFFKIFVFLLLFLSGISIVIK